MTHYIASWQYKTFEGLEKRVPFEHAGSKHYGSVKPGDVVWIVVVHDQRLYLVARLPVAEVISRARALRRWGNVRDAEFHIAVAPEFAEPLRQLDITDYITELRFSPGVERLPADFSQSFRPIRYPAPATIDLLESLWGSVLPMEFDPTDLADARKRIQAEIVQRQGQGEFRDALIREYGGRCAITGCDVVHVLEAAHIVQYSGPGSNHVTNGILLRADLHSLFDAHLLAILPGEHRVALHPDLRSGHYAEIDGAAIRPTRNPKARPDSRALALHLSNCKFAEAAKR